MRFLFVDRIDELGTRRIRGTRHFGPTETLVYPSRAGATPEVAPGAVSEAIGQLASWLCIKQRDFSVRPIFLFAEAIATHAMVNQGDDVTLEAEIHSLEENTFVFSGTAKVGDKLIQTVKNCNGYFMPLGDLEDPSVTRQRLNALENGGLVLDDPNPTPLNFNALIDRIVEVEPGEQITATKTFGVDAPFYSDHFPRFPVTPIVVLNEVIGAAAKKMLLADDSQSLRIRSVEGIKIKSFVKPNEEIQIKIRVSEREGALVTTMAQLIKGGKPILRGRYLYEVTG